MTYSNVMSTIAVLGVLLGGSAYAAKQITSRQIQNGTIQSIDIGNGKVTGTDLANSTVTSNDIANGGVVGLDIAANAIGNGQLQDGAVEGENISDGSVALGDLSGAAVNALTLASIDGTECHRNDADGEIQLEYSQSGYSLLFCEIPVTPEASEPNDTQIQAEFLVSTGAPGLVGSLSSATDVDWYQLTAPCTGQVGSAFIYLGTGTDSLSFDANNFNRHVSATVYVDDVEVATSDLSTESGNFIDLSEDLGVCTGADVYVKVTAIGDPVKDTYRLWVNE